MNAVLRPLSADDGMDVYTLLQEIPKEENGFLNGCNGKSYEAFKAWLIKSVNTANGIGLESWMVPQTVYWLYVDGQPVAMGKLRHALTDKLREEGGHCGYAVSPSHRCRGYGKLLLRLLMEKARDMGIDDLLVTIQRHNAASLAVALANGGRLERSTDQRYYVWISTKQTT